MRKVMLYMSLRKIRNTLNFVLLASASTEKCKLFQNGSNSIGSPKPGYKGVRVGSVSTQIFSEGFSRGGQY